jgi:hypothetical protein
MQISQGQRADRTVLMNIIQRADEKYVLENSLDCIVKGRELPVRKLFQ